MGSWPGSPSKLHACVDGRREQVGKCFGNCEVRGKASHRHRCGGRCGRKAAPPEAWRPFTSTSNFPFCTYTYMQLSLTSILPPPLLPQGCHVREATSQPPFLPTQVLSPRTSKPWLSVTASRICKQLATCQPSQVLAGPLQRAQRLPFCPSPGRGMTAHTNPSPFRPHAKEGGGAGNGWVSQI